MFSVFHSIGKILYNKVTASNSNDEEDLNNGSASSCELIVERSGVEDKMFVEFLHENYLPHMVHQSKLSPNQDVDTVATAADYFTIADVFDQHLNQHFGNVTYPPTFHLSHS